MARDDAARRLVITGVGIAFLGLAIAGTSVYYLETRVFREVQIVEAAAELLPGQPIARSELTVVTTPAQIASGSGVVLAGALDALSSGSYTVSVPVAPGAPLEVRELAKRPPRGERVLYFTPQVAPPNLEAGSVIDILVPQPSTVQTQSSAHVPYDVPVATGVTVLSVTHPSSGSSGSLGIEVALPPAEVAAAAAAATSSQCVVVFSFPGARPVPVG
ncbi:hypothetical protein Afer_0016 [Acidimicrobium ferrooxidans DSM 10331]|uniref:SAF domain-containing protein n=1 Tax=Acidimicrobium ferrooxidans (strain DSM 10331 / JCM 15462 / NBRC 103882 / ICP) TaxID=525909 RepID=C7M1E2_ACIFD|nr:hypothetical protein [Acidimicrobium ferrooxidans]ACU52991.1 hypothetical protein Afer_0016 [Acidimicrobium ferrooxidans DSM 10331]